MKIFYTFFLLFAFTFPLAIFAESTNQIGLVSTNCFFNATLRVGSVGEEVKCLQTMVGAVVDGHFGPKTRAAVMAWQLNHNLIADGVAGPLTRTVLKNLTVAGVYSPGCSATTIYSATTGKKCDSGEISENPTIVPPVSASSVLIPGTNLAVGSKMPESLKDPQKNLEDYINWEKDALVKRGESSEIISILEEKLREGVTKNPNAIQQFFDAQRDIYYKTVSEINEKTPTLSLFSKAISFFNKTLFTNKAEAAGGLPFGGFITVVNPAACLCTSATTGAMVQVKVTLPGAPTGISNMVLNYRVGTQAFLNYNMPLVDIAALGFYNPAGSTACLEYVGTSCAIVPAAGIILPMVGSSLSPG